MKTLDKFESWKGQPETIESKHLQRVSRWITIKQNYDPCKNNRLWDYVTDESGYYSYQDKFTPDNNLCLDYFRFNGRTYAINQFFAFGSIADCIGHSIGYIENDEKHYLAGYDSENYYNPLLIEIDEYGEKVRLYIDGITKEN